MDKELRANTTLHQIGAILLATIVGTLSILILGAALFGCATVTPYVSTATVPVPNMAEEFIRWTNDSHDVLVKRIIVSNPFHDAVRVRLDCDTPSPVYVQVAAESSASKEVFGDQNDENSDACHLVGYEVIR